MTDRSPSAIMHAVLDRWLPAAAPGRIRPFLRRWWRAYLRLLRDAEGVEGVRCGSCDAVPPPGETLCASCNLQRIAAP